MDRQHRHHGRYIDYDYDAMMSTNKGFRYKTQFMIAHMYPSSWAFPVTAIIKSPSVATILDGSWITWVGEGKGPIEDQEESVKRMVTQSLGPVNWTGSMLA